MNPEDQTYCSVCGGQGIDDDGNVCQHCHATGIEPNGFEITEYDD